MGTVTGVGGGVIRDVLLARVPLVLHADIYATAAFAGAFIVVVARRAGLPPGAAALAGGSACFILRVLAVTYGWQLPKVSPV
ncbi:trimeric intracellular cation channel family protein [Paraburkholderia xenovorans]